mmetsp:Transcript_9865/g.14598  ORF Transcript_9865/g.14598 Transcript_9865/m.14598 type:complete len:113 (+) Transcript_9865:77-415(+)
MIHMLLFSYLRGRSLSAVGDVSGISEYLLRMSNGVAILQHGPNVTLDGYLEESIYFKSHHITSARSGKCKWKGMHQTCTAHTQVSDHLCIPSIYVITINYTITTTVIGTATK